MNRTVVERVHCILSNAKLSKQFWGKALRTAIHIINITPSSWLDGNISEHMWTEREVSYDYLLVFWCQVLVHVPKDERTKLDTKSRECIFLGYPNEEFGYRLWDPVNKKIVRS